MASDSETDTERTVVQVYVPAYQRAEWDEHADDLGMSRSEFVKTMVQAGRRGFGADTESTVASASDTDSTEDGGEGLREKVIECLGDAGPLSWDELLAAVSDDIENRLERTLSELQDQGKVRHSGREGGYVLESDK